MKRRMVMTVVAGLAGAVMAIAQSDPAQQPAQWQRAKNASQQAKVEMTAVKTTTAESTQPGDGDIDEALRWERAKDQAAKRQAQADAASSQNTSTPKSKKK
jgi:hypothetical protein